MKEMEGVKYYTPIEEKTNIISHAIGFVLSIIALVLLVTYASLHGNILHIISFSIFGASLIILFAASTCYHSAKKPELRKESSTTHLFMFLSLEPTLLLRLLP
jgi:hemolysin III